MTRLERLRGLLTGQRLPAVLLTEPHDVAYLSGFRGSNGALLVTADEQVVITDFRYFSQVAEQAPGWELVRIETGESLIATAAKTIGERAIPRVGFQSDQLTFADWEKLAAGLAESDVLVPVKGLVAGIREVKEPAEIEVIRRAAALADETMERGLAAIREGLTERELKAELEYYMVSRGAEGASFDMIIAGGPHSALPHAPISGRPFARGDLVIIDLGTLVDGYCSDLTRTAVIGPPDGKQSEIYRIVYEAQIAALAAIQPGITGRDVDEVARAIIRDAGYGEYYGHGLGHGVGLQIHEGPRLASSSGAELVAGNVVTVEPGIYLPDFGGVRIEDLVVVTETGCERLSQAPKPAEPWVL